ncbi:hypothetical protein BC940DRAFT_157277 [Gongronella butleri]|nr:hypothetical protein BC940DRAFT_157277 [Gongronella butleri]
MPNMAHEFDRVKDLTHFRATSAKINNYLVARFFRSSFPTSTKEILRKCSGFTVDPVVALSMPLFSILVVGCKTRQGPGRQGKWPEVRNLDYFFLEPVHRKKEKSLLRQICVTPLPWQPAVFPIFASSKTLKKKSQTQSGGFLDISPCLRGPGTWIVPPFFVHTRFHWQQKKKKKHVNENGHTAWFVCFSPPPCQTLAPMANSAALVDG